VTEIVPTAVFHWVLILATGGVGVWWVFHDLVFFARLRGADGRDPQVRDQRFAYVLGVMMAIVAIVGAVRFLRHIGVI